MIVRDEVVRKYGATDRVWVGRYGGVLDGHGVQQEIAKIGKGIQVRLYPHRLRHTFAIEFLRSGANTFELQYALGHSSLEMARRYCQALGFDDVFKKREVASPLDKDQLGSCEFKN